MAFNLLDLFDNYVGKHNFNKTFLNKFVNVCY